MLTLIAALAADNTLGHQGKIPWDYAADRKRFRQLTMRGTVVMGRRTWSSLKGPLPGRANVVLTSSELPDLSGQGHHEFPTLARALEAAREWDAPIWIIGGARLYTEALPLADRLELTRVPERPDGDVKWAPDLTGWRLETVETEGVLRFETWARG